jgi:hypothetical protein
MQRLARPPCGVVVLVQRRRLPEAYTPHLLVRLQAPCAPHPPPEITALDGCHDCQASPCPPCPPSPPQSLRPSKRSAVVPLPSVCELVWGSARPPKSGLPRAGSAPHGPHGSHPCTPARTPHTRPRRHGPPPMISTRRRSRISSRQRISIDEGRELKSERPVAVLVAVPVRCPCCGDSSCWSASGHQATRPS